jgi:hypothetical protein
MTLGQKEESSLSKERVTGSCYQRGKRKKEKEEFVGFSLFVWKE